jgi:hypothetical protein
MDFIRFEKVSIAEAKAVLDGDPAPPPPEKNWAHLRDANATKPTDLTEKAWQWVDALPKEIQPGGLIQRFPRITNRLAEVWRRPSQCEKYLDTLMLDQRGGRKGFPPDVVKEIALLKIHFNQQYINSQEQSDDVWGERIKE